MMLGKYKYTADLQTDQSVCPMTKQRIRDTAFSLFSTHSYKGVSMEQIAKTAGVSKGGVFHYYPSKYDLAMDCLINRFEQMGTKDTPANLTKEEARTYARELISLYIDFIKDNPMTMNFFLELYQIAIDKNDTQIWEEFYERFVQQISVLMEMCGIENPRTKAILLMATLDAVGLQSIILPNSSFQWDELKGEIFQVYIENNLKGVD